MTPIDAYEAIMVPAREAWVRALDEARITRDLRVLATALALYQAAHDEASVAYLREQEPNEECEP